MRVAFVLVTATNPSRTLGCAGRVPPMQALGHGQARVPRRDQTRQVEQVRSVLGTRVGAAAWDTQRRCEHQRHTAFRAVHIAFAFDQVQGR